MAHAHGALQPEAVHARAPCLDQAQHAWKGKSAEIFVLPHHFGHVQRDVTDAMGALVAAWPACYLFSGAVALSPAHLASMRCAAAPLLGMIFGLSEAELSRLFRNSTSATMPRQKEP